MQQTNDNVEACRVASCHLPILPIAVTRLKSLYSERFDWRRNLVIFLPLLLSYNAFE
jgi:hypothetical protein